MIFRLNQKVTSRKTGMPMVGKVLAVQSPIIVAISRGVTSREEVEALYPNWTTLYPDWTNNWVYTVLFDKPMRHMSYSEYLNRFPYATTEEYEQHLPILHCAMYPESDLETIDIEERLETSEINSSGQ
jgi:hypothetical protein